MSELGKVRPTHTHRAAIVYVRQSSASQVEHNRESAARQYALVDRAIELGWSRDQVTIVDEDLGLSGAGTTKRAGFARLAADVALAKVGIVFGLEVSRLARNNTDWYRLLDLCGMTDTLIGDADGVYHPALFNDRLVLGLNRPDSYSTSYSTFRLDVELRCAVPMPSRRQRYPTCLEVKRRPKAVRHPAALSRSAIWAYVCRFAS
jgi:Resolvase, N terminal domain